jgi:uroporphyrinogen decarboxylase
MAYKLHSMISPRMARRYLVPARRKWIELLKARSPGVVVTVDSDGYVGELLPLFIEAGFDATWPVEVAAGNDLNEFRRRYGRRIAYGGGMDKRRDGKASPGVKGGGYLPGCDHGVPPDISWLDFIKYGRVLARMEGGIL